METGTTAALSVSSITAKSIGSAVARANASASSTEAEFACRPRHRLAGDLRRRDFEAGMVGK